MTSAQARDIACEAALYSHPVVEMYRTLYAQAVDAQDPNFNAGTEAGYFVVLDSETVRLHRGRGPAMAA